MERTGCRLMQTNNALRAVLLDFDGTLVDSLTALKDVYFEFLSTNHVLGCDEEFELLNGPSILEIVEAIRIKHNLEHSTQELQQSYMSLLEKSYRDVVRPYDGAAELLSIVRDRGLSLGLVTAASRQLVDPFLSSQNWQNSFQVMVTSDDVVKAKPDPAIYLAALGKLGLPADNVWAVEDSRNGIRAANGAGLRVIGVSSDESVDLVASGATLQVAGLSAVADFIRAHR